MSYVPEHLNRWDASPSGFDSHANYVGADMVEFYVAPVSINRDTADSISLSNWRVVTAELEKLAQHEETAAHRFGHWACGWYELFLIHETDSAALECADNWAASLADYCIASEDDLLELEHDLESDHWDSWAGREWRRIVETELQSHAPNDAGPYWAEEHLGKVSDDALWELWHSLSQSLGRPVEWHSDGPSFDLEGARELITADTLASLTGLALLAPGQEWRREPYPWPGAEPSPIADSLPCFP